MKDILIEHSKLLAVMIGILLGYPLLWQKKEKLHTDHPAKVFLVCLLFSFLSVLSAALFASFERIITGNGITFGGVSTYGVYFLCPLFLLLITPKGRKAGILDCLAFYAVPSLVLQRVSCFITNCCYGNHLFSVSFKWPVRESEILFYILIFLFLLKKEKDQNVKEGALFPYLMIGYGIFRFINEFFRYTEGGGLFHLAHVWSLLSVIAGWSVLSELVKKHR